jgi:hypothetical protein
MSRRVVLRLTKWSADISGFEAFIETAKDAGAGPHAKIQYATDAEGHPCAYIELPEKAVEALERRERPKTLTKTQQAVKDQLEDRKRAVAAGDAVTGHVPPVRVRKLKPPAKLKRPKPKE